MRRNFMVIVMVTAVLAADTVSIVVMEIVDHAAGFSISKCSTYDTAVESSTTATQ